MSDAGAQLVYGIHAVSRLLQARPERIQTLLVSSNRDDAAAQLLIQAAQDQQLPVDRVSVADLDRRTGHGRHQGVVAYVVAAQTLDENGLQQLVQDHADPLLLALDGVQDPHNLGACMRTAEAAGASAVIIPKDRAVGLNATVRKVAAGSADFIPLARVTNLARVLQQLAEGGVWCYGAAAGADTSLYDIDLTGPLCLVLGGEAQGLRRLTRERCDRLYTIPMAGSTESLNVSVAAGISLFEACRQRRVGSAPQL